MSILSKLVLLVAATLLTPAYAIKDGADTGSKGRYDFNYIASGSLSIKPLQVFDDGTFTYFQFATDRDPPTIFSVRMGRERLETVERVGQYTAIRGLHPHYELRAGDALASVTYRGFNEKTGKIESDLERRVGAAGVYMSGEAAPSDISEGGKLIDRTEITYKIPFRRGAASIQDEGLKAIKKLAGKVTAYDEIIVYARPDREGEAPVTGKRAEAIYKELIKQGISADRVTSREQEASRPENGLFYSEVLVRAGTGAKTPTNMRPVIANRYTQEEGGRSGAVFFEGREPAIKSAVRGMGRDITMRDALMQIIPSQYQIYNDGVSMDSLVTWAGDKDWTKPLHDVVRQAGISAVVNWEERSITLTNAVSDAMARRAGVPQGSWSILRADAFLSKTLVRWGKAAGWQVSWDASNDFPVTVEANFSGSFEDAVTHVVNAISGTDYPIKATFHSNNVVQITRYTGNATETIGGK